MTVTHCEELKVSKAAVFGQFQLSDSVVSGTEFRTTETDYSCVNYTETQTHSSVLTSTSDIHPLV